MNDLTRRVLSWVMLMATIFAFSCDSENNIVVVKDRPSDYFPLKIGAFQVYDVHQVVYTLGVPTGETYQLKTQIVDSIDQGNGSYAYVQYLYKRASSDKNWVYASTWAVQADERELVVNEANTVYLKYRFPLTEGHTWNGNTYNSIEQDEYVLEGAKVGQTVGGISYNDCLVVNQHDNEDVIVFLDQRKEVYARNVGLVSKEVSQLHYCTSTESGCLGQQVVEEGIEYIQTLATHGRE
jgi:hypothetical protein